MRIKELTTFVLEAPIAKPVRNSWRTLTSRSSLLIRITDHDGAQGWGEVWCNYPPRGAHHRADLLNHVAAPLIVDRDFGGPEHVFRALEKALRIPTVTSGEPGPFAQIIAGIDNALWDLVAKRTGKPLWQIFGGVSRVEVYASGLSPDEPGPIAEQAVNNGFRAAKLKVGSDAAIDRRNSADLRAILGTSGKLRALGVTTAKRSKLVPDMPTIAESGLPGYEVTQSYGMQAPAGTPKEVIARINGEVRRILALPDIVEKLATLGAEPAASTPEVMTAYVKSEVEKWSRVVKASGAKAD